MALWFPGTAAGSALAAQLITAMEGRPDSTYYLVLGVMTLVFTAVLAALVPWIRRRMATIEAQRVPAAH